MWLRRVKPQAHEAHGTEGIEDDNSKLHPNKAWQAPKYLYSSRSESNPRRNEKIELNGGS